MSESGKRLRAPFLYQRKQPIVIAPIDDLLIFGPKNGLEKPAQKIASIADSGVDAILTFCGSLRLHAESYLKTRKIVNLSGSVFQQNHTKKLALHSVEHSLSVGADAIAFHINLGSQFANEMIAEASKIIAEADRFGLPSIGIIYPRGEIAGQDENYDNLRHSEPKAFTEMVAHCVAVGADLGFDAIKTVYTGHEDTFHKVVESASGVPILIAGGPIVEYEKAIARAASAISAGASGISFGRNLFGRTEGLQQFVKAIKTIEINT